MKFIQKIAVSLFMLLLIFNIQNSEAAIIHSTFDDSTEGWIISGGDLLWSSSGGNPGGYIIAEDKINTYMKIEAPSKFLGDWSEFENGTISFDAIELVNPYDPWPTFGTVTITGDAGSVSKDLALDPLPSSWTHYSAMLTAEEWEISKSDWEAILNNVTMLTIDIESGMIVAAETVGVDNIVVTPVPIPAAVWLLGTGFLGLLGIKLKLQK